MQLLSSLPLVSIGVPTYNRPTQLEKKLQQLSSQTYTNLQIIVSDNCSPDPAVELVVQKAKDKDNRIQFFRQKSNLGASENFLFVKDQANGDFFLWAADDDGIEPQFIETLIKPLLLDPNLVASFTNIDVRYPDGSLCTNYPDFFENFKFFENDKTSQRLTQYIIQNERHGKANLFYSLLRKSALDKVDCRAIFSSKAWGSDMLFVCHILSLGNIKISEKVLYHVGLPFNGSNAPADSNVTSLSGAKKLKHLLSGHAYYFLNYLKIVCHCRILTLKEKLYLMSVISKKWMVWIYNDFK